MMFGVAYDEQAELVSKFAMLIERKMSEAYEDLIADARAEVRNKHGQASWQNMMVSTSSSCSPS